MKYDVAIIGLGPSGLEFAKSALKLGLKVIAFEKSSAGGTCLNLGCVPTKTMLSCAEVFSKILNSTKYAIELGETDIKISYKSMCNKRVQIVEKIKSARVKDMVNKGLEIVPHKASVVVNSNTAHIVSSNIEYSAEKIVIATGSRPSLVSGFDFHSNAFINSDDLLTCDELPNDILIIGSGAIGIEWATIFNTFGVNVCVVEMAENLAPSCDLDICARLERIFKMKKIKFYKNATLVEYKDNIAKFSNGESFKCDKILFAAGRKPVLPEITGVNLTINPNCTTNIQNLYVIGDATGGKMLAHAASHQAKALFNNLYKNKEYNVSDIPSVIYTTPEIASIGIREQDIDKPDDFKIIKLPISYLAKSWCDGEIDGFIKLIIKNKHIKGAHIVSKEASAMIMQIAIAMKANMDTDELCDVVFAHPTYSEGIMEALNNA